MSRSISRFILHYADSGLLGLSLVGFAFVTWRLLAVTATGCNDGLVFVGIVFLVPVGLSLACAGYAGISAQLTRPVIQTVVRIAAALCAVLFFRLVLSLSRERSGTCESGGLSEAGYVTVPLTVNLAGYLSLAAYAGSLLLRLVRLRRR
jgi:hypothetical protein